jgi:hypothetical protein
VFFSFANLLSSEDTLRDNVRPSKESSTMGKRPFSGRLPGVLLLVLGLFESSPLAAQGVALFRDRELRGPSMTFYDDVPDLRYTGFGSRRASSIDVSPGCVAILFERPGFRGRRTEFRERDNNLANTAVGEDSASSIQIRCR